MTPFEAFHAGGEVHRKLVRKGLSAKNKESVNKRDLRGDELQSRDQVWPREF